MLSFARQAHEDTDLPSDNGYQVITPYGSDSIVMVQVVLPGRQAHEDTDSHQLGAGTTPGHFIVWVRQYCAWHDYSMSGIY